MLFEYLVPWFQDNIIYPGTIVPQSWKYVLSILSRMRRQDAGVGPHEPFSQEVCSMSRPICGSQSTTRWYPPGVLVGASPTHFQLFSPETAGDGAQGISPRIKKDPTELLQLSQRIGSL
jgi:hypothetical protein